MRWARSAHTRPMRTDLSKEDSEERLEAKAAARRRAIFCCGVSFEGALPKSIWEADAVGAEELKEGVPRWLLAKTEGPIEVKRVASLGERAILDVGVICCQGILLLLSLMHWCCEVELQELFKTISNIIDVAWDPRRRGPCIETLSSWPQTSPSTFFSCPATRAVQKALLAISSC